MSGGGGIMYNLPSSSKWLCDLKLGEWVSVSFLCLVGTIISVILWTIQLHEISMENLLFQMQSILTKGHYTHEPRAVTMKLREPKKKSPEAIPRHLQKNHVVWSRILKCSAASHVTRPSTKCNIIEFLFMRVLTHDKIWWINGGDCSKHIVSWFRVKPTSKRWFLKIVEVTTKHDPFDAM